MRKIREVLRLKFEVGLSHRQVAAAVGISHGSVSDYLERAKEAELTWESAQGLSDAEVEARLFQQLGRNEPSTRAPVDLGWVHREMRRAGVTLQLLWSEYQAATAERVDGARPYQYSQFCDLYRAYRAKLQPSMRQVHRAGEKGFIDFSGKKPRIHDPKSGEALEVELYVMVLGASNYTYATATRTQSLDDFVEATARGLEYFGCVPEILVPDQLRSAVKKPDWSEPEINETFAEMAQHYGAAIVPARPGKPKDKAKVEVGVQVAQRWILARLRNRRFFSLAELNEAIAELCEELNTRPFKKLEGCRRSLFESLDRPSMRPLPPCRYELGRWKQARVNIDYHVEYEGRYYSVPCELIGEKVELHATATVVEVWREGARVTSHARCYGPKGTATTKPEHRPRAHRDFGDWPPERLVGWARQTGPATAEVVEAILSRGPHPECGRRSCLGLLRMGRRYGHERLEAACKRALAIGSPTRKTVQALLKNGLDKTLPTAEPEPRRIQHENIRGGDYFDRGDGGADGADEMEAEYLDEERLAIMNGAREGATALPGAAARGREGAAAPMPRALGGLEGPTPAAPVLAALARAQVARSKLSADRAVGRARAPGPAPTPTPSGGGEEAEPRASVQRGASCEHDIGARDGEQPASKLYH